MSAGERPYRPTPADIRAAAGKTVPDVIAPGLAILFVGINPGLYTARSGIIFRGRATASGPPCTWAG